MNGHQRAVLWIGLILVAFNLVRKWSEIAGVIFSGAGAASPASTSPASKGCSIQIPVDPFLATGPKITVPIPCINNSGVSQQEQQVQRNTIARSPTGTISGSRL